jgi:nucleoside-diphosphate-sugar epimerase
MIVLPSRSIGAHDWLWSGYLIGKLVAGGVWHVGGGRAAQTFIGGPDLGRALVAAARRGQPGHTYLLGGFDATWLELLKAAAAAIGVPLRLRALPYELAFVDAAARELTTTPGGRCWPNRYAIEALGRPHLIDDSRSRRQLTWSPQIGSVEEAIGDVVRWYREPLVSAQPGRLPS